MDLIINGYGGLLRKTGNRFVVGVDGGMNEFPAKDVKQILINDAATVTTGAMRLAVENDIDLVIVSKSGTPMGRLYPCLPGKMAITRKNQIMASSNQLGYNICAKIISAKIINTGNLIESLGRNRNNKHIIQTGREIARTGYDIDTNGNIADNGEYLRGKEGETARRYFQVLKEILPDEYYSGRRSQHPAEDLFNSYLNYGYGILYNEIERACLIAGLDPYSGFLHSARYGKTPLVYDIIEQFRQPVIDRVIITLAIRGQMSKGDCDNKFFLTADGRRKVIGAVLRRFDESRRFAERETSFRKIIHSNVKDIVHCLNGMGNYKPFIYHWR